VLRLCEHGIGSEFHAERIMTDQRVHPIHPDDIYSLTDFQRETKARVAELQEHGRPAVLTVNGKASLVVQDASAYQRMLELADQMDTLLAVREGLDSMERGEGVSLDEFDATFRAKHNLPRRRGATGTDGR
jgi:PHD/YefM family antitoxin component YafN of YafNO toxin-antitoxin module